MLAGGREQSDWIKNMLKFPGVRVKIGESIFNGQGRVVDVKDVEEDRLARKLVFDKYTPRDSDGLTDWARTSLPVALEIKARTV